MATPYRCIGGPLDGEYATYEEVQEKGYAQFNCAHRCNRTKLAKRRAAARGEIIPPSMVWLHYTCFAEKEIPCGTNSVVR